MSTGLQASFIRRFPSGQEVRAESLRATSTGGVTVLFGPSGSGKTTILRCLAGLDVPAEGSIAFDGVTWFDATRKRFLSPQHRNIGFVPQDYALFPHLTVAGNIGYGLRGTPAAERHARVTEIMNWLDLAGLENRLPEKLSGGQQQRVALARAVAHKPQLLLLDEPLSALDAPTRERLRNDLRNWLAQLAIPAILVTHDRNEALALGDQFVAVYNGRIEQVGSAEEVFSRPASLDAARVVGTETVLPGRVAGIADGLATVLLNHVQLTALAENLPENTTAVHVCIRAEDVIVVQSPPGQTSARNRLAARVISVQRNGLLMRLELDCGFALKALLTPQSATEMNLKPGVTVIALIKAPHVHLIPRAEHG